MLKKGTTTRLLVMMIGGYILLDSLITKIQISVVNNTYTVMDDNPKNKKPKGGVINVGVN